MLPSRWPTRQWRRASAGDSDRDPAGGDGRGECAAPAERNKARARADRRRRRLPGKSLNRAGICPGTDGWSYERASTCGCPAGLPRGSAAPLAGGRVGGPYDAASAIVTRQGEDGLETTTPASVPARRGIERGPGLSQSTPIPVITSSQASCSPQSPITPSPVLRARCSASSSPVLGCAGYLASRS